VRNLHRNMGQPVAHGAWVLLYLNGKFWGLYNVTERVDLQYLRSYSDKDSDWDVIKKEVGINTRIIEKPFIHSCDLKFRFVQRAREYLGVENPNNRPEEEIGQLSNERVKAEILAQAAIIRPFIQLEADRWAPFMNTQLFDQNIENSLRFVDERQEIILHHLAILEYKTFTGCR